MIFITGANGFVGRSLCNEMLKRGLTFRPASRDASFVSKFPHGVMLDNFGEDTDWRQALAGCKIVVHLAARVPKLNESSCEALLDYERINVNATLSLAKQAAELGVERFIFISSVKVNGESTFLGRPYRENDLLAPEDIYGCSKAKAEDQLKKLVSKSGMELTIIRPPIVYGRGVKGNFLTLLRLVKIGIPIPLGSVTENRRSMISADNLVDFILRCVSHPRAGNNTFFVSDGEDLSTADLLARLGKATNRSVFLFKFPIKLLEFFALIFGMQSVTKRVLGSLQVDIQRSHDILQWSPPVSVDESLYRAFGEGGGSAKIF